MNYLINISIVAMFYFLYEIISKKRGVVVDNIIILFFDCLKFLIKCVTIYGLFIIFIPQTNFLFNKKNINQTEKFIISTHNKNKSSYYTNSYFDVNSQFNINYVQPMNHVKSNNEMESNKTLNLNATKKNLVVFKFDEIFTSQYNVGKFENLNNFVNLVINSFEPVKTKTEVAIIMASGGGNSLFFERAYANLKRLSKHGYKTYALIDGICASGCYMMACSCNQIIANNHSTIGSIGVYTKRYNGEKLGKMLGISEIIFKTSKKKGDLPFFGPVDDDSIDYINSKINKTMEEFTKIVKKNRPNVDPKNFDADVWYTDDALKLNMIDEIKMIDDFIKEKQPTHNIFFVKENTNQHVKQNNMMNSIGHIFNMITQILNQIELN